MSELLADKLDLPDRIFEKYFSEPDSLTGLIHTVYRETDSYFRENDQETLASLSLMAGWIEAMYIGANIYLDKGIIEMSNRILQHAEIRYAPEGFRIDPEEGKFHATASVIRYETGTLDRICRRIITIRGEIIQ